MKPVQFHPEARAELRAAARYYESQQKGLGRRFLAAVRDGVNRVQSFPLAHRTVEEDVRQCRTWRFPFGLLYRVTPERFEIIAVMHLHREPGYWKRRLRAD
ncbi:MAG: plasmid stabilization protein [Armatimonadetes bacterium CG2_30_66_41]|nr:type II toxin-antitoxin system RelE/ParE family toxin [Armatimonadota bacterium]NCQ27858.1 type II toxin-antitoxin system RelE/ParE family toxin [Armatimonadota bacterium]OIO92693.1 MAG: plasmid stabilization protein [Armatimonadetes bacterium CG2_30_66_41]PIU88888.1 MAG: plasmid stabilization protein [Armatimonadetes bacterium CG06_land_8_20_14_3_00_66_21]